MLAYTCLNQDQRVQRCISALQLDPENVYVVRPLGKLSFINFFLRSMYLVLADRDLEVVYCHDFYCAPQGILAHVVGKKVVFDAHECVLDYPPSIGLAYLLLFYCQQIAIRRSNCVIFPSEIREKLHRRLKLRPDKSLVFGNLDSLNHVVLRRPAQSRLQKAARSVRIGYAGSIEGDRDLDKWLRLTAQIPQVISLEVIGGGSLLTRLQSQYRENQNIRFFGPMPYEKMIDQARTWTAGIITYNDRTLNTRFCVSNKPFDYTLAGCGIIARSLPGLRAQLRGFSATLFYQNELPNAEEIVRYCCTLESHQIEHNRRRVNQLAAKQDLFKHELESVLHER